MGATVIHLIDPFASTKETALSFAPLCPLLGLGAVSLSVLFPIPETSDFGKGLLSHHWAIVNF